MPPSCWQIIVYLALFTKSAPMSLTRAWSSRSAACGPVISISPMCERSKRPAELRTAWCSASSL